MYWILGIIAYLAIGAVVARIGYHYLGAGNLGPHGPEWPMLSVFWPAMLFAGVSFLVVWLPYRAVCRFWPLKEFEKPSSPEQGMADYVQVLRDSREKGESDD